MRWKLSKNLETNSGNFALIDSLRKLGITFFAGVNGGGVIHVMKYLLPYTDLSHSDDGIPRLLTMGEYVAGFIPVGYYLASGKIAGCITTTGAATKLGSSGITDAKLHNIPAVYIMALNSTLSIGMAPLQDVSEYGMNIVPQLKAELGEGAIVVDNINTLEDQLHKAQKVLLESKPVAIAFYPDILSKLVAVQVAKLKQEKAVNYQDVERFLKKFPLQAKNRRIIIYVCSEAARYSDIQPLTTKLSKLLHAPTVWSVNGANAVSTNNPYGYGYISFGGNDRAIDLWRGINKDDVVIALGFDAGEYSLNLAKIPAGVVWHFTNFKESYGHKHGEFKHRIAGDYHQVRGDIDLALKEVMQGLKGKVKDRPEVELPKNLNTRVISRDVKEGCVDFVAFYEKINKLWRPNSIGCDDVCVAYKDRQYVTQRPHPNIKFHTTHDGSAMGGGFGLGVGAKIANPRLHTFVFSGDGCFRLFGGCLADAANFDIRLFIINNGTYCIVDKGLEVVIPKVEKRRYHSKLPQIDFVAAARAHGWDGYRLKPDLSNLKEIMDACYETKGKSVLIDVPVDNDQTIGTNPRLSNLTTKTYL